ncbi:TPA: hypothetical protein HA239_06095 [Candidatus Woesearchaeota archaeon]|nr:hypothetical protein [Candidatus Woesearchaeota archaeon]
MNDKQLISQLMKIEGVKKLDGTALDLEELVKLAGRTGGEIEYVTDRRFIGSKALKIAPDAVYIGNGELLELLQQLKGIKGFPIQHLNEVNKDLQTSVYRQRFLEDTPEFKFKEKNILIKDSVSLSGYQFDFYVPKTPIMNSVYYSSYGTFYSDYVLNMDEKSEIRSDITVLYHDRYLDTIRDYSLLPATEIVMNTKYQIYDEKFTGLDNGKEKHIKQTIADQAVAKFLAKAASKYDHNERAHVKYLRPRIISALAHYRPEKDDDFDYEEKTFGADRDSFFEAKFFMSTAGKAVSLEDAIKNRKVRYVPTSEAEKHECLDGGITLVIGQKEAAAIQMLLGSRDKLVDYSEEFSKELQAKARIEAPKRKPGLKGRYLYMAEIEDKDFHGFFGMPLRPRRHSFTGNMEFLKEGVYIDKVDRNLFTGSMLGVEASIEAPELEVTRWLWDKVNESSPLYNRIIRKLQKEYLDFVVQLPDFMKKGGMSEKNAALKYLVDFAKIYHTYGKNREYKNEDTIAGVYDRISKTVMFSNVNSKNITLEDFVSLLDNPRFGYMVNSIWTPFISQMEKSNIIRVNPLDRGLVDLVKSAKPTKMKNYDMEILRRTIPATTRAARDAAYAAGHAVKGVARGAGIVVGGTFLIGTGVVTIMTVGAGVLAIGVPLAVGGAAIYGIARVGETIKSKMDQSNGKRQGVPRFPTVIEYTPDETTYPGIAKLKDFIRDEIIKCFGYYDKGSIEYEVMKHSSPAYGHDRRDRDNTMLAIYNMGYYLGKETSLLGRGEPLFVYKTEPGTDNAKVLLNVRHNSFEDMLYMFNNGDKFPAYDALSSILDIKEFTLAVSRKTTFLDNLSMQMLNYAVSENTKTENKTEK